MQTVTIGKKSWATGLFWVAPDGAKQLKKLARGKAIELNEEMETEFSTYVVRSKEQVQFGFGECDVDPIPAIPSLAAALAQAKPGTWMGRFILPDGVYVVGVMESTILAQGDFLGSEEEADIRMEDLDQLVDLGGDEGWDTVFTPATEEESLQILEGLLSKVRGVPKTAPVVVRLHIKRIVGVSAFLLVALIGFQQWGAYKDRQALRQIEMEQAAAAEQAAQLAAEAARKARENVPRPWLEHPAPANVVLGCRTPYEAARIYTLGWTLTEWECGKFGAKTLWTRTDRGSFLELPEGAVLNMENPMTATSGHKIIDLKNRGKEALIGQDEAARRLFEWARKYQATIAIKWDKEEEHVAGIMGSKSVKVEKEHKRAEWILTKLNQYPQTGFADMLDRIPGVVLNRIWFADQKQWTLEGELYVKK